MSEKDKPRFTPEEIAGIMDKVADHRAAMDAVPEDERVELPERFHDDDNRIQE